MALVGGIPRSVNPNTRIKGFDKYLAQVNKRLIQDVPNRSMKGLIMAAAHIRQETESKHPMTPLDYGNLRSSWFVVTAKGKVPNDAGNKGFRDNPEAKLTASQLQAEHVATITECKGIVQANEGIKGKFLIMGYSANYALFVHEMLTANFKVKKGRSPGAKWFEIAFKRNRAKILQIIKDNAEIKG